MTSKERYSVRESLSSEAFDLVNRRLTLTKKVRDFLDLKEGDVIRRRYDIGPRGLRLEVTSIDNPMHVFLKEVHIRNGLQFICREYIELLEWEKVLPEELQNDKRPIRPSMCRCMGQMYGHHG